MISNKCLPFLILATFLSLLVGCVMESDKSGGAFGTKGYKSDLQQIIKKGKLVVLAENSSSSYFIYRERKMGFEYEVLQEFCKELGVDLEIKLLITSTM